MSMIEIGKLFAPGTFLCALLIAGVSLLLIWRRGATRRIGATLLTLLATVYLALALPFTADLISAGLLKFGPLTDPRKGIDDPTVVIISGDSEHARIVEGLRLFYAARPRWVVSSGSPDMVEELRAGGIP